jgi:hypothetical protein
VAPYKSQNLDYRQPSLTVHYLTIMVAPSILENGVLLSSNTPGIGGEGRPPPRQTTCLFDKLRGTGCYAALSLLKPPVWKNQARLERIMRNS